MAIANHVEVEARNDVEVVIESGNLLVRVQRENGEKGKPFVSLTVEWGDTERTLLLNEEQSETLISFLKGE